MAGLALRPARGLRAYVDIRPYYSVALLCLAWEVGAWIIRDPLSLPTFSGTVLKFVQMLGGNELTRHIASSLGRALLGFGLAAVVGVAIGLAMGRFHFWESFWSPLVSLTYPVPKVGLVPLFILWLGLGEASKLAVIFTAAVYPVIINTHLGIKGVPKVLVWRARTFGATQWQILFRVVFLAALPHILNGLRLAMGISWIVLFAAEMVASRTGLGFLILFAEQMFQTDLVFVSLLTIALLGFLFDRAILYVSRWLCDWYFRQSAEASV